MISCSTGIPPCIFGGALSSLETYLWQWKLIPISNKKYLLKWWIFHCHVGVHVDLFGLAVGEFKLLHLSKKVPFCCLEMPNSNSNSTAVTLDHSRPTSGEAGKYFAVEN